MEEMKYISCVQLPIFWKTHFFKLAGYYCIFAMKRPTDKIKHVLEAPFLSFNFFILYYF
jgi:hypothetical protein